ncbi:hypothetical protein [Streptomyces antimycoticus]
MRRGGAVRPAVRRCGRRGDGLLPPPDHVEGGKPYWYADTIRSWVARRPGNRRARRDAKD